MADITHIFGGPWSPAKEILSPPEEQLRQAMQDAGLTPPDGIHLDGQLHRFRSGTKGKPGEDKAGWYVAYGDGIPAGSFGCWRAGIEQNWRADIGRDLTAADEMAIARRMAEAKAARQAERERTKAAVSVTVEAIWANGLGASPDHPYLARKCIAPHGARVTGDGRLIVPLYNADGEMVSLQYISSDGGKLYHRGGQASGAFWWVGEPGWETLYIAEGFATAATIHDETGQACYVAYSASNLPKVAAMLRERYGNTHEIVIVADHDDHGVGQMYADQAAAESGVRVVKPPIPGMDANDYHLAGHNLMELLEPPATDWLIPADEFSEQPAPIRWLVKHWLQDQALMMVHGPSGGGKTFLVLDWCHHVASSKDDWHGHKVKTGSVVYLAGEGHHGLRGRVAAWKRHHGVDKLNMWLSRTGCDLNTPDGYLKATSAIRSIPESPILIVVDTLHRFLAGDENSAQDAKTMLDACGGLMREFGCSVLLVHHTGVSEEAQHRARGSSAWKGALDIEISVVPPKGSAEEIQVVQRKNKDAEEAEPMWGKLDTVTLEGWVDEDGEPVTSAVFVSTDAPNVSRFDGPLAQAAKIFAAAWEASGCEYRDNLPYLSRSALKNHIVGVEKKAEGTAENYCRVSSKTGTTGKLYEACYIEEYEYGFRVVNQAFASQLSLGKK